MNQLDIVTQRVCNSLTDDNTHDNTTAVFIDPATMMMAASIIIEVVKIIKQCKTEHETIQTAARPTIFDKRVVYRQIRKKMSFREYLGKRHKIADAIFNIGSGMNEREMSQLFDEVV